MHLLNFPFDFSPIWLHYYGWECNDIRKPYWNDIELGDRSTKRNITRFIWKKPLPITDVIW